MTDLRQKTIEIIKSKTGLDDLHATDAEIGIYNWCIDFCDSRKIFKSWKNNRFSQLYLEKARSIVSNMNPDCYLKNENLLQRIKDKEYTPHEISFMKPDMMFPERWKETTEAFFKKFEHAFESRLQASTSDFRCGKCGKRECVYWTKQIRSADEPETIFIRCIVCGNGCKIG